MSVVRKNFNFENINFNCWALIMPNGSIFLKLKELAKALGYTDVKNAYNLIKDKWKLTWSELVEQGELQFISQPHSNWQSTSLFVSEPGLYALIFRSHKPEAKRFTDYVFEVILPEIRKKGGYISPNITASQANSLIKSLQDQLLEKERTLTETQGELAVTRGMLQQTQGMVEEKDRMIAETQEVLAEKERMIAETRENLAEKERMLTEEMRQKQQLQNDMQTVQPKIAVIPDRDWVRHTLNVYKRGNQYICTRVQKRSLENTHRRIPIGYQLVYTAHNVPNALNVVNRLRELLPTGKFFYNKITSNANVVELIEQCVREINRPITQNPAIQ